MQTERHKTFVARLMDVDTTDMDVLVEHVREASEPFGHVFAGTPKNPDVWLRIDWHNGAPRVWAHANLKKIGRVARCAFFEKFPSARRYANFECQYGGSLWKPLPEPEQLLGLELAGFGGGMSGALEPIDLRRVKHRFKNAAQSGPLRCMCGLELAATVHKSAVKIACDCYEPSSRSLAFFTHRSTEEFDSFFCGCRGWD